MTSEIIQEIYSIVKAYPRNFKCKLSKEQIEFIESNADPKIKNYKFAMKVYWVIHDIHEFPICENDGKPITKPIISIPQGYFELPEKYRYCCGKCRCKDKHWIDAHSKPQRKETIEKRLSTNNKKYGGNAPACSKSVVDKMKSTKKERYGDSGFTNHEKAVKTCEERYGVVNVSQLQEVKDKKEKTCLKHHGIKNILCDGEYMKQVFMNEFGVDNPMKVESIKNRAVNTARERRCTDKWKENHLNGHKKSRRKWILMWNDSGEHNIVKQGTTNESELNKWEHNLQFDSKPEIKIFLFCKVKNNMDIEYQPNITFNYIVDDNVFIYMPDFKINGKLYEFKGEQFFRINESTGKEEMYMPWRSKNISDEEYIFNCRREESKHQCMLKNNVIILRDKDIKNISVELFN